MANAAGQEAWPVLVAAEVDPKARSATLDVFLPGVPVAPVRVTAQLDPGGGSGGGGLHVKRVTWGSDRPLLNATLASPADLVTGIVVLLDGDVAVASVQWTPVARVTLERPWPLGADVASWVVPGRDSPAGGGGGRLP